MPFKVLIGNKIHEYQSFDDIPSEFDNLISFSPDFIPPPHTPEEHIINDQWQDKFKDLMSREIK